MKIPFWEELPKFEPRVKIGVRKNMSLEQREILDAIDVLEQKADFGAKLGVRACNIGGMLFMIVILTNGPEVLKVVQHWFKGLDVASVAKFLGLLP